MAAIRDGRQKTEGFDFLAKKDHTKMITVRIR